MRLRILLPCLVAAALLCACGGSAGGNQDGAADPDGTPPVTPLELILVSAGLEDGHQWMPGGATSKSGTLRVGDHWDNTYFEGYVVFPVAAIPAGAVLQSAVLDVYQFAVTGTPYLTLGNIVLDEVNLLGGLRSAVTDYPVLKAAFVTLSSTPAIESKTVDVMSLLEGLLAEPSNLRRTNLALRLRFEQIGNADEAIDAAEFDDGFDSKLIGKPARIFVTYTMP